MPFFPPSSSIFLILFLSRWLGKSMTQEKTATDRQCRAVEKALVLERHCQPNASTMLLATRSETFKSPWTRNSQSSLVQIDFLQSA